MAEKKPRCGAWMSHKFREGNGPIQDNCLRCGWLHADVARVRRNGGFELYRKGRRTPKPNVQQLKADPFIEAIEEKIAAWKLVRDCYIAAISIDKA